MRDPLPENIDGRKEYRHVFEHRIDWGQMTLGVGVLAAAYVAYRLFVDGESQDDLPMVEAVEQEDPQVEGAALWSGGQKGQTHR